MEPLSYDYTDIVGLENAVLEDSWVRDLQVSPMSVRFALELAVTPQHPRYSPFHPGEQYCYLEAVLFFESVTAISWTGRPARSNVDPDGSIDFGNIDTLARRTGQIVVIGEFGELALTTDKLPRVELE
ncbi:MAG: hypothetical protein J7513_06260 [Solirubrobacteraceae bacterium]|nr:hypothetical protein [Solirubrobacteraceae bacterium]